MNANELNSELQAMRDNISNREQLLKIKLKRRKWAKYFKVLRLELDNEVFALRAEIEAKKEYMNALEVETRELNQK